MLKRGKVKDLYLSSRYHFRISMGNKLFIYLVIWGIPAYLSGQVPREEVVAIKDKLQAATSDSARFSISMDLSQAYRFSNVDSALYYTDQAIQLGHAMNNAASEAEGLSQKGFIVLETGDIPQSLQYQLEALRLSEKVSDPVTIGFIINRIGNVYTEIGDYKKAIDYYRRSIEHFTKAGQQGYVHNELSNIGYVYELMGVLDSSKIYQQKVYEFSLTNTDRYAITYGEMRERIGKVEAGLGNYDAALNHFRAGIVESLKDVDMNNLALIYLQMAKLFSKLGSYDSGFIYAKKAIATADSISLKRATYEASALLANLFKLKHQPDSALAYSELSSAIKDSLYGQKKIQELQRILLNDQQRQQELQEERDQIRERFRLVALLALLGVFLVIGIILYRNNRQKQKANKVLEETLANLKSTQSQLIQSEKMASLGELTAGIAHEIQNPLNFVNNFSDVNKELLSEMKDEIDKGNLSEVRSIANDVIGNQEKINFHGKRAEGIVKGMLQHSRSSSGQKEPTDINALADEYLRLAYHGLRAKEKSFNATLQTDFDAGIGNINIVSQDIGRVLLNLINNAFHAVSEKAKLQVAGYEPLVIVSTKKLIDKIEIKVSDNGSGIPQKIVDKIFQPFFTTKPTGQGTGLGLSLSYDIVKAHGGEIRVQTKEGEGSEFVILLPV
jgi:two-component system NtrC family sensor kinase